jgi:alginate O-acetyltransferase complex protein AlgJ
MNQFLASDELGNPDIDTVVWEFPLRTLLAHRVSGQRQMNQTQHF